MPLWFITIINAYILWFLHSLHSIMHEILCSEWAFDSLRFLKTWSAIYWCIKHICTWLEEGFIDSIQWHWWWIHIFYFLIFLCSYIKSWPTFRADNRFWFIWSDTHTHTQLTCISSWCDVHLYCAQVTTVKWQTGFNPCLNEAWRHIDY